MRPAEAGHSHESKQATLFIERLRMASNRTFCEQLNAQLSTICEKAPAALPLISDQLGSLKGDPDYAAMIGFLNAAAVTVTLEFSSYFATPMFAAGNDLSKELFRHRQALQSNRDDQCVQSIIHAMQYAHCAYDRWKVLKVGIFGLNQIGQHVRAQNLSFVAYEHAQQLEDEAMQQRCRFAILHSTRMAGNADMRVEYQREYRQLLAGSLLYPETNQCLVPAYAAMHMMDLGQDDKMLRELLHASREFILGELSSLIRKIAWTRYLYLSGRPKYAKQQLHEIADEFCTSLLDAPSKQALQSLSADLGTSLDFSQRQPRTRVPNRLWQKFDLAFNQFCTDSQQNRTAINS